MSQDCMIDWVSCVVPWSTEKPIGGDQIACISPDGDIKWARASFIHVEGSASARISCRSHPDRPGYVEISGNPAKFLQGHNLFGPQDLIGLVHDTVKRISEILGVPVPPEEMDAIAGGRYRLTRVDINSMWEVGSHGDRSGPLAWCRAVGSGSRLSGHVGRLGRGILRGDTVYFGRSEGAKDSSRYFLIRIYCKAQEIQAHGHAQSFPASISDQVLAWIENKLRVEIALKSMYLQKEELSEARNWHKRSLLSILLKHVQKIEVSGNMIDPEKVKLLDALPKRIRLIYQAWLAGVDVRANLARPTFYRYRKMLLPLGVDLAIRQGPDRSNVVPLVRVLEARPATIPQEFLDAGMMHQCSPRVRLVK